MQEKGSPSEIFFGLPGRIKAVRKHVGMTQHVFAKAIGVSRSYLAEVERGKGKPSLEMIVGIADKFPQISRDWLLTGQGDMLREGRETTWHPSSIPPVPGSARLDLEQATALLESRWKKRVEVLESELERLRKSRGAPFGPAPTANQQVLDAWVLLGTMAARYPKPCTLEELEIALARRLLVRTRGEILEQLGLLIREGLVEEVDGGYRTSSAAVTMRTRDVPNINQQASEAVRMLYQDILPVVEKGNGTGRLMILGVTIDRADRELPGRVVDAVLRECEEAMVEKGMDGAELRAVLGVAIPDKEQGV